MCLLLLLLALLLARAAEAGCAPPESGPYALHIPPGGVRAFAAGQRALLEGTARVAGGLRIRGTLFLSSSASSTLSADWVAVEAGGALVAGSEACPLPPSVTATIVLNNGSAHPAAGRKALAVLAGGTLELHGGKGLDAPWARLAATAPAGSKVGDGAVLVGREAGAGCCSGM